MSRKIWFLLSVGLMAMSVPPSAQSYSVLTHEAVVDAALAHPPSAHDPGKIPE